MKKFTLTFLTIIGVSAAAFASGSLDLRANYVGTNTDNNGTKSSTSGFLADRARVSFSGKLSEKTSGKAQLYFDSSIPGLKYGEISQKLTDTLTLSLGKIDDAGYGGFEGLKTTADQYFTSLNYKHGYVFGANLNCKMYDNQSLLLHIMNEGENAGQTGPTSANGVASTGGTSNGFGVRWMGSFGDSSILASYHSVPSTSATAASGSGGNATSVSAADYMTVGYQYKTNALIASFDYISKQTKTQITGAGASDGKSNSIVAMVDYNMGTYAPNFKVESSTTTAVNSTTESKQLQYSLGAHIIPHPDENFRYQIEYVGKTTNAGTSGAADITTSSIYAGVRLVADFLK